MFFADSLRQKIKSQIAQYSLNKNTNCLFPYKKPETNAAILEELQKSPSEFTHKELKEMTKEDYLKTFTIKRLKNKWGRKLNLNFDITKAKFIKNYKFKGAKEAKIYINSKKCIICC